VSRATGLFSIAVRRPEIGLLWGGQLLSALGDRLHEMALMWISVEALGGSAGLVAAAGTVAHLLCALPGGVTADRADRRQVMIAADLIRAAAVATLVIAAATGGIHLWHLAVVGAVIGGIEAFFTPALQASLPALAGDPDTLQRANALININWRLALIAAPALAGVLLAYLPITQLFTIDAATFVISAAAIAAIRSTAWRRAVPAQTGDARAEIATAVGLVRTDPVLLWSGLLIAACNLTHAIAWMVGLPLLARDVFGGDAATYGYLMAAYGVGNVVSNVLIGSRSIERRMRILFAGGLVYGTGIIALAVAPGYGAALVAAGIAALGGPMTDLMLLLLIQTRVPAQHVGKVLSLRFMTGRITLSAGLPLAAPLFDWLSIRTAIGLSGAIVITCAALALARLDDRAGRRGTP
jgi:MFS family permease